MRRGTARSLDGRFHQPSGAGAVSVVARRLWVSPLVTDVTSTDEGVGHRGAHAVVKGNTLGSFDAALDLGVDMIEFDVCAVRGRLGIAHSPLEGRLLGCLELDTG